MVAMIVAVAAVCCCFVGDDSDAATTNSVSISADYGKVSTDITFSLVGEKAYSYEIYWMDGETVKDKKTGVLDDAFTGEAEITLPSTEGNYTYYVDYYLDEEKAWSDSVSIKAVKAITLKATVKNDGESTVSMYVHFLVKKDGVATKVDGSEQLIKVEAGKSKDATCEYVVKDVSDIEFCITSTNDTAKGLVSGLDSWKTVYSSDNDYTAITVFLVIVVIIMLAVGIWILRKPVVNTGKPKARR